LNRVRLFTCLALVLVVVAFVAVWLTLPSGHTAVKVSSISYPARLFRYGVEDQRDCRASSDPFCDRFVHPHTANPETMRNHALVFFGGLAAVVLLLGIAFGAASRSNSDADAAPAA
jgi:hypothetical protein